jgi:hypothetical protein
MHTKDKAGGAATQTVTSMPWPLLVVAFAVVELLRWAK